jgi:hypothetical protein
MKMLYRKLPKTASLSVICKGSREIAVAPVLDFDYLTTARRVADRRMILAGYRLANLLIGVVGN